MVINMSDINTELASLADSLITILIAVFNEALVYPIWSIMSWAIDWIVDDLAFVVYTIMIIAIGSGLIQFLSKSDR